MSASAGRFWRGKLTKAVAEFRSRPVKLRNLYVCGTCVRLGKPLKRHCDEANLSVMT
jgi:hypothetical protein